MSGGQHLNVSDALPCILLSRSLSTQCTTAAFRTCLSHVRDVEQRGLTGLATPQVLLLDAAVLASVLYGKLVARKRDHLPAEL